jgi:hypothetical protein
MYFPDLIVLNKVGLAMMTILKIAWLIAGGWIWRVVRNFVFKKIKTNTFQGPTTVGIFMVVMPLVTIILICISLITGLPLFYVGIWLLVMWLGSFIRPPLHLIWGLLTLSNKIKSKLKREVIEMRDGLEQRMKG